MAPEPVLFVHPEYINNRFGGYTHHYGCSSIIGYLKRHGIEAETFLGGRSASLRQTAEALAARKPRFLGFSCYDVNFYLIRLLVQEFRRLDQEAVIVLGGPTPTFSWDLLLENLPGIDGCVAGDGEDVVLELLERGVRRDDLPQVEGFFTRGAERAGRPKNLMHNINDYPSPYVTGEIPGEAAPNVGLFSSRGCYYHCTFCNFSALSNFRVRNYTTERLLEEISRIGHGLKGQFALVPFYDDFFTIYKARTKEVCQGIIDNQLHRRVAFSCQTRVDAVDRDMLEILREANFRIISFGIESASLKVLKAIKKVRLGKRVDEEGYAPEREFLDSLRQGVKLARELGFRVTGSIILGLPEETLEDAQETLEFVRSLELDAYSHNFLNVFPGTELFKTHGEFGIGVEPSTTLLPFTTTPAYDVVAAGFLAEHADIGHHERVGELIDAVMAARSRGRLGLPYGDVFYVEKQEPGPVRPDFWDGLKGAAHPASYLILSQPGAEPAWCKENFRALVAREIPILEQKVVIPREDGDDFFISNRGEWGAPTRTFCDRAARRPFSAFFDPERPEEPRNVFYSLKEEEDRRLYAAQAARFARDGAYVLPETALEGRACVERLCAFGLGCPARSGEGVYRDDRGEPHTLCGIPLGEGDPGETLVRLAARRDAERGCDDCPASADCPRCLNPGLLPDEEYCRLLREGNAPDYARLLDFVFTRAGTGRVATAEEGRNLVFKGFGPNGRKACLTYGGEAGDVEAARRVKPGVFLMLYRGNPIFYEPASDELVEVSLPLAEVAEALHAGASPDSMALYFGDKYELTREAAAERIGQALEILGEYGLLEENRIH
ncbi:MAG TPA: radical SAM protein [Thermoanaerobaculia bacterium]|nr:radical SAM protein [Thermoanaerobaculia bacterium]